MYFLFYFSENCEEMMESEDGIKPFNCSICPLAFASKGNLSRHIKIKHEVSKHTTTTKFKCEICSARFNFKSDLKKHIASLHERKKRTDVSNPKVSEESAFNIEEKKHVKSVHEKELSHLCSKCDSSFTIKRNLIRHIAIVHEGIKPFSCEKCQRLFAQKSNMERHKCGIRKKGKNKKFKKFKKKMAKIKIEKKL